MISHAINRTFAMAMLTLLSLTATTAFSQVAQSIDYSYCVVQPDTACFDPKEGAVDTVGLDADALGGKIRICLGSGTINPGYLPLRVILVIDQTYSMCNNPQDSADGCCNPGDGTGNCMMNDPDDIRIQAARMFVDSLAARSPGSQVGVIFFSQALLGSPIRHHTPLILNSSENIEQIKSWIDNASCAAAGYDQPLAVTAAGDTMSPAPVALLGKAEQPKITLAYAMEMGLADADYDYTALPSGTTRHIIAVTDGSWDGGITGIPDSLIGRYRVQYPDRQLPAIHGIFLSNRELHTSHGYPADGCSTFGPVFPDTLKQAADLTGGLFLPVSSPATVVNDFYTMLDMVTGRASPLVTGVTVTNAANSETCISGNIRRSGTSSTWETTLPNLPLEFGPNNLTFRYTVRKSDGTDSTVTVRTTILRSERYRETLPADRFRLFCSQIQADITIAASPESIVDKKSFAIAATIANTSDFSLDTVQVRMLSCFPDNEAGVLATFHCDGNLAVATGASTGAGTPDFTAADMLFGNGAITNGSFTYVLPQLADAFVMESWVKPSVNGAAVLLSGNGMELGVTADMKLYLKNDAAAVTTALCALDDSVWSHIAVARGNGKATLFINGGAVSNPVDFTASVSGGAMTVSAPAGWIVDEVRFSNVNRITEDGTTPMLVIPTATITAWNIAGTASTGPVIKIAPSAWKDGTALTFSAACPAAGNVLVNIRQKTPALFTWSKNSNPVFSGTVSVEKPIVQPAIVPEHLLPGHAGPFIDLLGKKVDNARQGGPSRSRLPNGIYLNATKEKQRQQKNIIVK